MIDGNIAMNSHFENMSEKDMNDMHDHYTTIEGNRLIAEFLGWHLDPKRSLKYNSSWNWLMPVVEKINSSGEYDVIIFKTTCHINDPDAILFETTYETSKKGSLIMDVWEVIVEFIQWYNNQKATSNEQR